jgi:hypothetical protein
MARDKAGATETESKRELQRQMEEARERVSETVAEIKTVVAHEYEEVRGTVETARAGFNEVLDWRAEFERNPLVWGAGAVSVGILVGFGIARAFDDEDRGRGRRKKSEGRAGHIVAELSGFADVVLPTISAKVRELFGLDLDAYLRAAHEERRPARKRLAAKRPSSSKRRAAVKGEGRKTNRRAEGKSNKAKGKS